MKTRNSCTAAALSLVPGLGHIYIGDIKKGLLFLEAGLLIFLLLTVTACTEFREHEYNLGPLELEHLLRLIFTTEHSPWHYIRHTCIIDTLSFSLICYAMFDSFAKARKPSLEQNQAIYNLISNGASPFSHGYRFTRSLNAANWRLKEASSFAYLGHAIVITCITMYSIFLAAPHPKTHSLLIFEFSPPGSYKDTFTFPAYIPQQTKPISATGIRDADQVNQSKLDDRPRAQIKRIHSNFATPVRPKTTVRNSQDRTAESRPGPPAPNQVPKPIRPGLSTAQAFSIKLSETLLNSRDEGCIVQDHPIYPDVDPLTQSPPHPRPDYGQYMEYLQSQIKKHWCSPKDGGYPPKVTFKLSADGTVNKIQISRSSGSSGSDKAAIDAITNAAPFKHLPEYSTPTVDIEFTFD